MALPLMPKATAVWLVDNTALTFDQIADFCGLHPLEVQGVADGEVAVGIVGLDPITTGQLTADGIKAAEADPRLMLSMAETSVPRPTARAKGPRYTPVAKRQDRPNAISWLLRYHPELTDGQISKLVGTTKPTINSLRDRTHWNVSNIKLEDPVSLGMCSQLELDTAVTKALQRQRASAAREDREARRRKREAQLASGVPVDSDDEDKVDEKEQNPSTPANVTQSGQPRQELWAGAAKNAEPPPAAPVSPQFGSEPVAPPARNDALEREKVFGPAPAQRATTEIDADAPSESDNADR